jgi:hypothetical protein
MLRNRVLTLLGGCLLLGSAALADDLGYVDCASHPEETQLFAKARKSQDVVGTLPCGERFKIVLYGFIFSEVQTADGKVGYVYSSILTIDRGGTLQVRAASPDSTPRLSAASETTKIPADPKPAQPKRPAATPASLPTPPTQAPTATDATAASAPSISSSVAAQPAAPQADVPAGQMTPAAAGAPMAVSDAAGSANGSPTLAATPAETSAAQASGTAADKLSTNNLPTPPTTQAAAEAAADAALAAAATPNAASATNAPVPPATSAGATPADSSSTADADSAAAPNAAAAPAPDASAAAPEPAAGPAPRPQPNAAVEPGTPSPKVSRESWEKPNPGGKNTSLLEFFGGFAYARTNDGGGVSNNFIGGLGSFGVNLKPWLQITGDSSYNYYNVTGTKYVLYGNHYGPRIFWRRHNPLHKMFGITPFGEALFGGSREDVHWPASGGYSAYTTSASTFSWKVGGGIDMHASRLFEIRLIDVDYYRTSFGTGMNQSNYWVSTGIVLRLFRGWSD